MAETKLNSCPFCGEQKAIYPTILPSAKSEPWKTIKCGRCGATGPRSRDALEASRLWDTRAAQTDSSDVDYLLACLAEEAGEVVQACCKALRFGLSNGFQGSTNAEDINTETTQMWAVRKMLAETGAFPVPTCRDTFTDKESKLSEYLKAHKKNHDKTKIPSP